MGARTVPLIQLQELGTQRKLVGEWARACDHYPPPLIPGAIAFGIPPQRGGCELQFLRKQARLAGVIRGRQQHFKHLAAVVPKGVVVWIHC